MSILVPVLPPNGEEPEGWVTREESRELKKAGSHFFVNCGTAIRRIADTYHLEDQRNKVTAGTMRDAWNVRESAGYLVLQMRTANVTV